MNDEKDNTASTEPRYGKVDTWFDIVPLEKEIQAFWDEAGIFEKLRRKNAGSAKRFSFLDGPITANNPMGVHHAWGRTLKDVYQRYFAMNGCDQRYQNGFDCQGLWVEVEVEKELNLHGKDEIEAFGIDNFVEACKARVRKFSGIQTEQSIRLGQWMDWDDSYFTMSDENNYTIWSFLKKCHERGKIYRGTDVMPWSGESGCAYSQMEVVEGRKLVAHTALFLRFPLRGRDDENLLVWTTTPWTLTSNVAAAVNVDLEYVKLREKRSGRVYYFAAENLEYQRQERQFNEKKEWVEGVPKLKTIAQLFNERGGYEILGYVKGAELVGLEYDGPFDELEAQNIPGGFPFEREDVTISGVQAHRVIDGGRDNFGNPIVVAGEGTGIVHIAPGCGDIDHEIGKELGLPDIAPLDGEAKFLEPFGPFAGRDAIAPDTVKAVLGSLRDKDLLVATEQYPHIYPHCWRKGNALVFRLVDEWYINMDWRDEIKKIVDDIRWIPSWGRERELEWLTNMNDWMISKKRYWGLALPIWVCEKCENFEVMGGYEELKQRAVAGWEEFEGHSPHRPWIDQVKIQCPECGGVAHRVPDVGNPWLDAGIVPYSTVHYNADREYWAKWVPADLVLESFPGQFRNWFYSLLALSTMMEGIAPFKTLKGYALMRDSHGEEMHKSKGNAVWFDDAAERVGADALRWMFISHDPQANLNFDWDQLRQIRGKFLNTLWNSYSFFVNYARILGFVPGGPETPFAQRPDFDRWILTELQKTIEACRGAYEDYNARNAVLAIEGFVADLSNWYIRHNRRRFWGTIEDVDTRTAFETLFECLDVLLRLAAPVIPFLTEAMYRNMVRAVQPDQPESVHLCDFPQADPARREDQLAADMKAIIRLNSLALSARESKKVKVRQPLARLTVGPADEAEKKAAERFAAMLRDDLNVKELEVLDPDAPSPLTYSAKLNFKTAGPKLGAHVKAVAAAVNDDNEAIVRAMRGGAEVVTVTVDGATVSLDRADVLLQGEAPNEQAVAEEYGTWVSFDAVITEDLRLEGLMRDVLRKLQVLRKDEGLEIEDRITMRWSTASADLETVMTKYQELLAEELLVVEMVQQADPPDAATIKVAGQTIEVSISKAS
ncbi:MAG: isoleucine--tRNA ligase [Candidatus Lernaella stagnicola]|nr:isoleucine--tRNA ligase [Candidatus Lernaella stagnicola]